MLHFKHDINISQLETLGLTETEVKQIELTADPKNATDEYFAVSLTALFSQMTSSKALLGLILGAIYPDINLNQPSRVVEQLVKAITDPNTRYQILIGILSVLAEEEAMKSPVKALEEILSSLNKADHA